jgi:hypothetical protein
MKNTNKTSVRTVGVPADVRTGHLPHTSEKRYHLTTLAQWLYDRLQDYVLRCGRIQWHDSQPVSRKSV